jgi:hypothetical protein
MLRPNKKGCAVKHILICAAGLAALASCAPLETYYKPGADVATVQRQTTSCEVEALAKVPASYVTRQAPPRFMPPQNLCNAAGECRAVPGYFIPGAFYEVDPNAELRQRVEVQCMADAGFVPVSIPACPSGVAKAAPPRATTTLPPLNAKSCVIRNSDGSFQIVTQG